MSDAWYELPLNSLKRILRIQGYEVEGKTMIEIVSMASDYARELNKSKFADKNT